MTDEEIKRCDVCGWPLAESVRNGCVPGNCSQRPVPSCNICGKLKGQPPERCNGHYAGTSNNPSLPDSARLDWILAQFANGETVFEGKWKREDIDAAMNGGSDDE